MFGLLALGVAGKLMWLLAAISQDQPMPTAWLDRYAWLQAVIGFALLGVCVVLDCRQGERYGWLHWMGLFCGLSGCCCRRHLTVGRAWLDTMESGGKSIASKVLSS